MPESVFEMLARNESADTTGWPRRDGNAASWPRGPRTATRKRWELLHWPSSVVFEYDTLDHAVAALNHAGAEGVVFDAGSVRHTPRLWYGLRAGRCPQKLLPVVSRVWLRPIRPPTSAATGSSGDQICGSR